MRGSYILLVLLLCALAFAQDVTVTVGVSQPRSLNVYHQLSTSQQAVTVPLGSSNLISDLKAQVYLSCYGSYSLTLCAYFDDNQDYLVCSPLTQSNNLVSFAHQPVTASTITFSYQGYAQSCSSNILKINKLTWNGGPGVSVVKNLQSIDQSYPVVSIGLLSSLINTGGQQAVISSSDSRLVAWFAQPGSTLSPTSRTSTVNPSDEAVVCLNTDLNKDAQGNPVCDFVDAQKCYQKNSDWLMGDCCGDAPYSVCSYYPAKQAICGRNEQQKLVWAPLSAVGKVIELGDCPGITVVSNGSKYFTCSEVPAGFNLVERFQGSITINGREYACIDSNISECGGDNPISPAPYGFSTGERLVKDTTSYYCSSGGRWLSSLDSSNDSCTAARLTWTGTKCCGEASDPLQTYEDPFTSNSDGTPGGCFRGQFIQSGSHIPGVESIENYLGVFYSCGNSQSEIFGGTGITPQISTACGLPLQNAYASANLICTPLGKWVFTDSTDETFEKGIEWNPVVTEEQEGCCTLNQCWDGAQCVGKDQVMIKGGKGYRCQ